MMHEKTTPCPFCGAHGVIDTLNRADGTCGAYRVQCSGCGAATRWCGTEDRAWAAWALRIEQKKTIHPRRSAMVQGIKRY
ncbi:MAG: Lar family restriction alleviation protein [Treponema sp.]|jgi:hypothetical protein|nr:Lar family restriction alleviation protein [Treponema sp.]